MGVLILTKEKNKMTTLAEKRVTMAKPGQGKGRAEPTAVAEKCK